MIVDKLRQYYTNVIGSEPVFHQMNTRSGKTIGVFEWPAGTSRLGVHFYASAGAGHYGPGAHRHTVELFVVVNAGGPEVLKSFATMALNVHDSSSVAQHGIFVAGDWKVIKGRRFTGWVLTERPDDFLPKLELQDGGHVVFLDALPVFWEEAEYRHGNRSEELFEIWEDAEVESWNLDRGLPTGIQPRPTGPAAWLGRTLGKAGSRILDQPGRNQSLH